MTKKQIREANVLIGTFDDWIHCGLKGNFTHHYRRGDQIRHIDDFKYHCDWNWLMPVVEKCYTEKDNDLMADLTDKFDFWEMDNMFMAVVEYIKLQNNERKNKK